MPKFLPPANEVWGKVIMLYSFVSVNGRVPGPRGGCLVLAGVWFQAVPSPGGAWSQGVLAAAEDLVKELPGPRGMPDQRFPLPWRLMLQVVCNPSWICIIFSLMFCGSFYDIANVIRKSAREVFVTNFVHFYQIHFWLLNTNSCKIEDTRLMKCTTVNKQSTYLKVNIDLSQIATYRRRTMHYWCYQILMRQSCSSCEEFGTDIFFFTE